MIGNLLYIADDHPIIINALLDLFTDEFDSVKTFSNGKDLLESCNELPPSHIILDINMPLLSGVEFLEQSLALNSKRIIFSMYNSASLVAKCRELGATGFVLKTASNEELIDALKFDSFYTGSGIYQCEIDNTVQLSGREKEVLVLLTRDFNSKQIANHLCLSEFTVSTHRRNLKSKLNIQTTAGLVQYAYKNAIIQL